MCLEELCSVVPVKFLHFGVNNSPKSSFLLLISVHLVISELALYTVLYLSVGLLMLDGILPFINMLIYRDRRLVHTHIVYVGNHLICFHGMKAEVSGRLLFHKCLLRT